MNPSSEDIKDILLNESNLELEFAETVFIGKEETRPDNCVTIFDTPGRPRTLTNDLVRYDYPSVQVLVRNREYIAGWTMINDITTLLHGIHHETWNNTVYSAIICTGEPAFLDWDENGRVHFVANFDIQRYPE